ncbi:MAG: hypothetical protein E6I57_11915 [Chloroflexi bacterium]|nr:MAG: hypothetical protein E6I57_11915 [Chloroflexota bacterium]
MHHSARIASLLVIAALLVASCSGTGTPSATGSAGASAAAASATPRPPKDQVKLPSVVSTELNLASLIAYAKDYFGEENIEVTDFVLGSSSTLRAAMIAKEYDFGLFAFVHDPIARIAGSPWKMVIATYDREIFSLLVRTQLKDSVKAVADLKGMVNLGGDPAAIYTALQSGKVDAIAGWEPITSRVLETNAGYALVPIWDPKSHQEWTGSDHALALGLMTREDVIAAKPDLVKRMVNAHKKALDLIKTSAASALADVILGNSKTAEQFAGLDKALVVKLIERIKPGYGSGCLSKSGFDVEMNIAVTYQLVKQPITFQEFGNTTYAGECP